MQQHTVQAITQALRLRATFYATLNEEVAQAIFAVAQQIVATFKQGGKLLTCGNGGSAAEAQHLAEELIGRFRADRQPLPALALSADGTALTCIANDFGFEQVFARQLQALVRPEDSVLLLSTSGHSENLVLAARAAQAQGLRPMALLGGTGGALRALCDPVVLVPGQRGDLIQEAQLSIVHMLCALVEAELGLAPSLML